jgi:abortive infection bacteriophage resistance protein
MIKSSFAKQATTCEQQAVLLRERGMEIPDVDAAVHHLRHLNYYRLSAYWLPFEADHATHRFKRGTSFQDVLNLYNFDRELRLMVLNAIERVEVSVRCQWAYQMAHAPEHGPHAHLDKALAQNEGEWEELIRKTTKEVKRSKETFIKHLTNKYEECLPPIWAVCEVMSLGLLSRWYANLRPMPTRRAIADTYDVDEKLLASWLHHLSTIRNICAHHSRLWNRAFTFVPTLPRTKPAILASACEARSRKLYNSLAILLYLLDVIAPGHQWRDNFKTLVAKHHVPTDAMGFPQDWQERLLWQESRA